MNQPTPEAISRAVPDCKTFCPGTCCDFHSSGMRFEGNIFDLSHVPEDQQTQVQMLFKMAGFEKKVKNWDSVEATGNFSFQRFGRTFEGTLGKNGDIAFTAVTTPPSGTDIQTQLAAVPTLETAQPVPTVFPQEPSIHSPTKEPEMRQMVYPEPVVGVVTEPPTIEAYQPEPIGLTAEQPSLAVSSQISPEASTQLFYESRPNLLDKKLYISTINDKSTVRTQIQEDTIHNPIIIGPQYISFIQTELVQQSSDIPLPPKEPMVQNGNIQQVEFIRPAVDTNNETPSPNISTDMYAVTDIPQIIDLTKSTQVDSLKAETAIPLLETSEEFSATFFEPNQMATEIRGEASTKHIQRENPSILLTEEETIAWEQYVSDNTTNDVEFFPFIVPDTGESYLQGQQRSNQIDSQTAVSESSSPMNLHEVFVEVIKTHTEARKKLFDFVVILSEKPSHEPERTFVTESSLLRQHFADISTENYSPPNQECIQIIKVPEIPPQVVKQFLIAAESELAETRGSINFGLEKPMLEEHKEIYEIVEDDHTYIFSIVVDKDNQIEIIAESEVKKIIAKRLKKYLPIHEENELTPEEDGNQIKMTPQNSTTDTQLGILLLAYLYLVQIIYSAVSITTLNG